MFTRKFLLSRFVVTLIILMRCMVGIVPSTAQAKVTDNGGAMAPEFHASSSPNLHSKTGKDIFESISVFVSVVNSYTINIPLIQNDLDTVVQAATGSGLFTDSGQQLGTARGADVELGDLDGDGDIDAFVGNDDQPNQVWLNNGNGTFTVNSNSAGTSPQPTYDTALGDLDGDGDLDAFVTNHHTNSDEVWLNDGNANFAKTSQSFGTSYSFFVALGDVDNDGDLDAFIARYMGEANRVWLNDGAANFTDSGQLLGNSYSSGVDLGDLDNDGDLDAFVANFNNQPNRVWLNNGSGLFTDSGQMLGNSHSEEVELGDIDGDGDLDAVVANFNSQGDRVWLNNGAAIFTDSGQALGTSNSVRLALGDVDVDGDLDLAVVSYDGYPNRVWINNGSGQFSDTGAALGTAASYGVALADLDGDQDLDAYVTPFSSGPNQVWINNSDPPANSPPSVDAGGPYSVLIGNSIPVAAIGSDPENGALSYAWDLNNDSIFETVGQTVTFDATGLSAPSVQVITVQVTDPGNLTATDQSTVTITIPPSVSVPPDWSYESDQLEATFGIDVKSAGDVNGDGFLDLIIGAMYDSNGQTKEGRAYLFYGSSNGLATIPAWIGEPNIAETRYARAVASAGDVNGDGYSDIIVGAYYHDSWAGGGKAGKIYLYYGSANGLGATADWTYEGDIAGRNLGSWVSSADVNNDGFGDILVTSNTNNPTPPGKAYAFYGSSTGPGSAPNWEVDLGVGSGWSGMMIENAGDVNGDGYPDVVVGNPAYTNVSPDIGAGKLFLFYGSATGLSTTPAWTYTAGAHQALGSSLATGDFNNDGYSDIAAGAPSHPLYGSPPQIGKIYVFYGSAAGLSPTHDWSIEGVAYAERMGSALAAGDRDGDGFDDLLIGAVTYETSLQKLGRVFLYQGSANGLASTPSWSAEGVQEFGEFGGGMAIVDIDNNYAGDMFIGQKYYSNGQSKEGIVLGYYSDDPPPSLTILYPTPLESDHQSAFHAEVTPPGTYSYNWEFIPQLPSFSASGMTVTVTMPITYMVRVTATNGTETITATKTVVFD